MQERPPPVNTCSSAKVSKLDPGAKSPPARYVAFGAPGLMSIDTGGFDQEGQDDKEEEIAWLNDRDQKGDGITEDTNDGLQNDDEVNGPEKSNSHLETPRQNKKRSTHKSFEKCIEELKSFKTKHGHVRVTRNHDKSLSSFCASVRGARRGKGTRKIITEGRIKALDELGFDWGGGGKNTSFEERIAELKA